MVLTTLGHDAERQRAGASEFRILNPHNRYKPTTQNSAATAQQTLLLRNLLVKFINDQVANVQRRCRRW